VSENDGPATITVTLSAPSGRVVTADVVSSDGTATAGSDYTPVISTVNFDPGQIVQVLTVDVTPDALDEPDETVNLALTNPVNASAGDPNTAVLSILDQNELPRVRFTATGYSVTEGEPFETINVSLDPPSNDTVTVRYAISDGSATAGIDYTAASSGTLTFAPGVTIQSFDVTITDDLSDEESETVNLALSNETNATLGTPNTAVLTISDNDGVPTVQFSEAIYTVDEGVSATIAVTLSNATGDPVEVEYATSNGTAAEGSDYTASSGTLTFAPGETSKTFDVAITEDAFDESDETVNLTLSNPSNATLGAPNPATLIIRDNDGVPTVFFSAPIYTMGEDSGTGTIFVELSNEAEDEVTVQYAISDGTATAGSDYTATPGTLTFAPGVTSQSFTVQVIDDALDEAGPDETVILTLSNPSSNATLGVPNPATLTISDNDGGGGAGGPTIYLPLVYK
jgi:hypothetical protein